MHIWWLRSSWCIWVNRNSIEITALSRIVLGPLHHHYLKWISKCHWYFLSFVIADILCFCFYRLLIYEFCPNQPIAIAGAALFWLGSPVAITNGQFWTVLLVCLICLRRWVLVPRWIFWLLWILHLCSHVYHWKSSYCFPCCSHGVLFVGPLYFTIRDSVSWGFRSYRLRHFTIEIVLIFPFVHYCPGFGNWLLSIGLSPSGPWSCCSWDLPRPHRTSAGLDFCLLVDVVALAGSVCCCLGYFGLLLKMMRQSRRSCSPASSVHDQSTMACLAEHSRIR